MSHTNDDFKALWKKIDDMIIRHVSRQYIMKKTGCTDRQYKYRRELARTGKLIITQTRHTLTRHDSCDGVSLIPPEKRLDLALKAKARALGQPMAWMRGTWLQGQAGRNFMQQGGYL